MQSLATVLWLSVHRKQWSPYGSSFAVHVHCVRCARGQSRSLVTIAVGMADCMGCGRPRPPCFIDMAPSQQQQNQLLGKPLEQFVYKSDAKRNSFHQKGSFAKVGGANWCSEDA
eukprot:scaffold94040_cov97-Cyclotella_meneghiniana.AAC.1